MGAYRARTAYRCRYCAQSYWWTRYPLASESRSQGAAAAIGAKDVSVGQPCVAQRVLSTYVLDYGCLHSYRLCKKSHS